MSDRDERIAAFEAEVGGLRAALAVARRALPTELLSEGCGMFRAITEASSDGTIIIGKELSLSYLSPSVGEILGYTTDEIYRLKHEDFVHGDDAAMLTASVAQVIAKPRVPVRVPRFRARHKSGSWVFLEALITNMYDVGGVEGIVCNFRDVNDRVESQMALEESERRYRALVELSPDLIAVYVAGEIRFANEAGARLVGAASPGEVVGMPVTRFIAPASLPSIAVKMSRLELHDEPVPFEREQLLRLDGEILDVDISAIPFRLRGERAVQVIARDVSERERLERELRQAQKMESIGQLAGGIAHDFNNALSPILIYAELMMRDLPGDHPHHERARHIKEAAERARELTNQLLVFGRGQMLEMQPLDLNGLVANFTRMLKRTIREDITIELEQAPRPCCCACDNAQLEQVLLNLAVNAQDAMPAGGQLSIATSCEEVTAAYASIHADLDPGTHVVLRVRDDGCGIDPVTARRVFEPFFTTKDVGQGSGLGLSTAHGIVRQHNGAIVLTSEVGRGTEVAVYFPAVDGVPESQQESASTGVLAIGRGRTILVVEDDSDVRETICHVLARWGYRLLVATDGAMACAVAEGHAGDIDLLLSDVIMPGMNGRELAERIVAARPTTKVLLMTGYAGDEVTDVADAIVQKPVSLRTLADKLHQLLDGPD